MRRTCVILVLLQLALTGVSREASANERLVGASVSETVEKISRRLARQGFHEEIRIDHAAAAESVGLDLPPTQVLFFANDHFDTSLIRRRQTAALDLPLRFLVFEDEGSAIRIERNDVGFLIDRHELTIYDPKLWLLDGVLDQFGDDESGILTVESGRSFDETVEALRAELEARGFRIPLVIDYADRLSSRRKRLRPTTLFFFGNPNVGTPLMQSERSIALDLPQKMLVYRTRSGRVRLAYNDPFFLARKHDVVDQDPRLGNIAAALANIAESAAGRESE